MSTITVADLLAEDDPTKRDDYDRDQYDRPLIVPRDGGKAKGYTRASSAAKTVDDNFNLELWGRRNVAYGMAHDRSLPARLIALGGTPKEWTKEQRAEVNKICEAAQQVAKAHEAADIGTALHKLTEHLDRGNPVQAAHFQPDLDAYQDALDAAGIVVHAEWVECRLVCDDLEMAGTADRIVTVKPDAALSRFLALEDNEALIADLKTGEDVDYGALSWAAQLAAYAHGELYDIATDGRLPTPRMNQQRGLIIHLPAGQARCDLYLVDLVAGYEACLEANRIRAMRKAAKGTKNVTGWLEPLTGATPPATVDGELMAALEASVAMLADKTSGGPDVPAEHIVATSAQLRARLGAAVAAGARQIHWPDRVARFADGGPATWAEVLQVERVVMDAEREADMPFAAKLPDDPTVQAEPSRAEVLASVSDIADRQPPIGADVVDELKAMHDALPADLQDAAKGAVIAAGLPTDRRLWRAGHRESLAKILQAAADEHAERKAAVASTLQGWEDDDLLSVVLDTCADPTMHVNLELWTHDETQRLVAVIEALDTGFLGWDDTRIVSRTGEAELVEMHGSKAEVLSAARQIAARHGLTKPRSAAAAASDPVLAALLLSATTNKQKADPS